MRFSLKYNTIVKILTSTQGPFLFVMLEPTWEQSAGIILNWMLEKGF
jgi:hypothetical protein